MPENQKPHIDTPTGENQRVKLSLPPDQNPPVEVSSYNDVESRMRQALGLSGAPPAQQQEADRMKQPDRAGGGYRSGFHRRTFVRDGDVPVTVLRPAPGHNGQAHPVIAPTNVPTITRLHQTEAALAAETAAREKAEQSLKEADAGLKDLQTRVGHIELTKNEAIEALRHARELISVLKAEAQDHTARLQEAQERAGVAEMAAFGYQNLLAKARAVAAAAAEQMAIALSEKTDEPLAALSSPSARRSIRPPLRPDTVSVEQECLDPAPTGRRVGNTHPAAKKKLRHDAENATSELKPVMWWLHPPRPRKKSKSSPLHAPALAASIEDITAW